MDFVVPLKCPGESVGDDDDRAVGIELVALVEERNRRALEPVFVEQGQVHIAENDMVLVDEVLQATVVAVGSGGKGKSGEIEPVSVKVGDKVLLPEYGGTKVVLDDKDYFLFRDSDILGKYVD